ncbi:MAG: hypothetical protein RSA53_09720 [Odoribacter sp.]
MDSFEAYIREIQTADVVLYKNGKYHFMFNKTTDIRQYENFLFEKELAFINDYTKKNNSFDNCLKKKIYLAHLNRAKCHFICQENQPPVHKNLHIIDGKQDVAKEDLPPEIQKDIDQFILQQYANIHEICSVMFNDSYPFPYRWNGKPSQLLELCHSLLACQFIVPIESTSTQQDWYRFTFKLFHAPAPKYIYQIIYKLINRKHPSSFLTKLRNKYIKFVEEEAG